MDSQDTIMSMFIDDELSIDEKKVFVERVHASNRFKDETIALLDQEKELRAGITEEIPDLERVIVPVRPHVPAIPRPLVIVAAAMVAAVLVLSFALVIQLGPTDTSHRFVVYLPDASRVDIAGSFTGWEKVPLRQQGGSGYWEITLDIPLGEHRFTYVLEDDTRFVDPTVPTREHDDFGGENSILLAGTGL